MTQLVPATCVLGPGMTGLTIGLRVLNLDGTTYAAFSATDVAETSTAGTYRKAGGVVVPLAGGYIVWGTALVDYAEATVESAAVNVTTWAGVATTSNERDAMNRLYDMIGTGLGQRYFNSMALQQVKNSIGLAAANLDTQLSTIDGIVDALALVAPDNQPIVNADGETLAYMTALSEEEIAAAVIVALQETPVEVICVTPQPSQESDYDILRNNATNC